MTSPLCFSPADDCREALSGIDAVLTSHSVFWRPQPFLKQADPQWQADYPALADHLLSLDSETVLALQSDDALLLQQLEEYLPVCADIRYLISLPASSDSSPGHRQAPAGVPGNKWRQILAFTTAAAPLRAPMFEWCSGKSFLGEALLYACSPSPAHDHELRSVDIDAALLEVAAQRPVPHRRQLICADVLKDGLSSSLQGDHHLLGLHACGGLHQRMLTLGARQRCQRITLSPCCYHRFSDDYRPLSQALSASSLRLSNDDLRLAVRQSTTARRGERVARRQLQLWYIALLQLSERSGLALSRFQSLPHSAAKLGFTYFCRQQLAANGVSEDALAPDKADFSTAGNTLDRVERFGLVSMAFRRLLEMRCVMDSVQYLCEQGYSTELSQFCPPSLSPRNILINARRL